MVAKNKNLIIVNFRCPNKDWNDLKNMADKDLRSANDELIWLIQQEMKRRDKIIKKDI